MVLVPKRILCGSRSMRHHCICKFHGLSAARYTKESAFSLVQQSEGIKEYLGLVWPEEEIGSELQTLSALHNAHQETIFLGRCRRTTLSLAYHE